MDLDQFKTEWKKAKNDVPSGTLNTENKNAMNTMETIRDLNNKTLKTAKLNAALMSMLVGMLAVGIILALVLPHLSNSLDDSLPGFLFLLLFCIVELRLNEKSKSIFLNLEGSDIKNAISTAIRKWNRWYRLSNIVFAIFMPPLFYLVVTAVDELAGSHLPTIGTMIASLLLTALSMFFGHLHYKSTYIRIRELKKTLTELE